MLYMLTEKAREVEAKMLTDEDAAIGKVVSGIALSNNGDDEGLVIGFEDGSWIRFTAEADWDGIASIHHNKTRPCATMFGAARLLSPDDVRAERAANRERLRSAKELTERQRLAELLKKYPDAKCQKQD